MICGSCAQGNHQECDDVASYERFERWLREWCKGKIIGAAENAIIYANRPYKSCPCHHDGTDVVDQTDISTLVEKAQRYYAERQSENGHTAPYAYSR